MSYNPYTNNILYGQPNYQQQIQQQIANLQAMQQQMGNGQQFNQNQTQINRGTFIQVKDYQEVVNYPTDASGTPTLFMNDTSGVFWVKKFIDGSNKIQAYSYAPINDYNNTSTTNSKEQEKSVKSANKSDTDTLMQNFGERISKLEELFDKVTKPTKKEPSKNDI